MPLQLEKKTWKPEKISQKMKNTKNRLLKMNQKGLKTQCSWQKHTESKFVNRNWVALLKSRSKISLIPVTEGYTETSNMPCLPHK